MRTTPLNPPHGGTLTEQALPADIATELAQGARHLPAVALDDFHYHDLICLATGIYSPLTGFQDYDTVLSVLQDWRLPDGPIWPIPVTLPVDAATSASLKTSRPVRLTYRGSSVAIMHVKDRFWLDPRYEAEAVYGTLDAAHPGVARVLQDSPIRLAGPVTLLADPVSSVAPVLTPRAMRKEITARGWHTVAAFQTRNPLHRAHEYIQKVVLESIDGLVLHPLIGTTKSDDVPVPVRWQVYQVLLAAYYPPSRTLLSGFPAAMRYAGPREALLHALARKNYGFTHFIVGRDHAGVGSFYSPTASQEVFRQFSAEALGIHIIPVDPAFYCRRCEQMATARTCPHDTVYHEVLSGTRLRQTLARGHSLPPETIRPEVAEILKRYYESPAKTP